MSAATIIFAICVAFVAGTIVALLLVGGARHTGPHPVPPVLRTTPRDDRSQFEPIS